MWPLGLLLMYIMQLMLLYEGVREALISHLKKNFVFYFEDMVIPFGKLS
jgi:hypothetical protein